MREILFRGKRIDNGEWICGNLTVWSDGSASIDKEPTEASVLYAVDTETVGQYTGLTDKNGKKIFEGDIVKHYNHFNNGFDIGAIYWSEKDMQWRRTSVEKFHDSSFTYSINRSCDYEVIGNVTDNPELLEGGEE